MMLSPDKFFGEFDADFPVQTRSEARKLFRRAIRDYYVMRRRYVVSPESGKRVQSVLVGEVIHQQRAQRRKVKQLFTGHPLAGRPKRPEIERLVSRLFILWGRYAQEPATFSWKTATAKQTNFEAFLFDLMPRLGARDVRRYVEAHWRERK